MRFEAKKTYWLKGGESFRTPVLNGEEIGGSWEYGRHVELTEGNRFRVLTEEDESGWHTAEMVDKLWFEIPDYFAGGPRTVSWEGKFHLRKEMINRVGAVKANGGI